MRGAALRRLALLRSALLRLELPRPEEPHTLVAALPAVLAAHPTTHLLLYGPDRGGTIDALKAQGGELGLTERVRRDMPVLEHRRLA